MNIGVLIPIRLEKKKPDGDVEVKDEEDENGIYHSRKRLL